MRNTIKKPIASDKGEFVVLCGVEMRRILLISVFMTLCWACIVWSLQQNRQSIQKLTARLRASATENPEYWRGEWQRLGIAAREKAYLYEQWLEEGFLEQGMVVNRHSDGRPSGECDSLLFSSLRYAALTKLGWHDKAYRAWRGIQNAFQNGRWVRHPKCRRKSTSRDMIVGLLVAMTQNPPAEVRQLQKLLNIVDSTGGSVDDGPFYVSRMSPGMGAIMRLMSQQHGVPLREIPEDVRMGFSTLELDAWMAQPGYTAHLNALTLWIELELTDHQPRSALRSVAELIDTALGPLGTPAIKDQRWVWAGHQLATLDRSNLFFEYMELRSAGALTWKTEALLLKKLLEMPQFPDDRLPHNCDRRADYLWQRHSVEYVPRAKATCHETFNGVDFVWMVALLTENL